MIVSWTRSADFDLVPPDHLPSEIQDRDADVWEALITIADAIGGAWPERARVAAVALVAASKDADPSLGIRLLADLRVVFGSSDKMATKDILRGLMVLAEAPWGDLKGKPLDDRGLARRLKQYSIKSKDIKIDGVAVKGYDRTDLHDAWSRYLPPLAEGSATSATNATRPEIQAEKVAEEVADVADEVADARPKNGNGTNGVAQVADVAPVPGHGSGICVQCNAGGGVVPRMDASGELVWLHPECVKFWGSPTTSWKDANKRQSGEGIR